MAVLAMTAVTAVVVVAGPVNQRVDAPAFLRDSARSSTEVTDRLVFVSWCAVVLGLIVYLFARRVRGVSDAGARSSGWSWLAAGLAVLLAVTAVLWQFAPSAVSLEPRDLALGFVLTAALAFYWRASRGTADLVALVGFATVVALTLPRWLQVPAHIGDAWHFPFTVEEVAAPGAGRIPLSDFFPQYTNLLGWPLAPILHAVPDLALTVSLAWMLVLQLVAVMGAASLPAIAGGRRLLLPALAVCAGTVFMGPTPESAPATYFAVMPLRTVLPVLTILVAYLVLSGRWGASWRSPLKVGVIGLMAGVSTLNNPDYGLPVAVMCLLAIVIVAGRARAALTQATFCVMAVLLPFAVYGLTLLVVGHPARWDAFFLSQRVFAIDGYMAVAMRPFGLHVLVAALFGSAAAIGLWLVVRHRADAGRLYRIGLTLLLAGGWSFLCLPYFVGRSFTSTLIGGFALNIGLVVACFLPLLRISLRALSMSPGRPGPIALGGVGLLLVATAACVGAVGTLGNPATAWGRLTSVWSLDYPPLLRQQAVVETARRAVLERGGSSLAVTGTFPGLASLATGARDASVVSNPLYFDISDVFVQLQCEQFHANSGEYLLLDSVSAERLKENEECRGDYDFAGEFRFFVDDAQYAIVPPAEGRGGSATD